jgi:hypothetical protein
MSGSNSLPHAAENPNAFSPAGQAGAVAPDAPLTMTVHGLPTPGAPTPQRQMAGRWKMLLVMLVCAAPVLASYFTFYVVRPEGRRNYGELVNPAQPLPDVPVLALDGKASKLPTFKGQWLLVSVAPGSCNAVCEKQIYLQRQMREGLGREKDRLDRIWLITDDAPIAPALAPQVHAPLLDTYALRMPEVAIAQWLRPAPGRALADHLYLVDPAGNWMMRFPADIEPAKAKRDIERLLRASNSWDRAGREKAGQP